MKVEEKAAKKIMANVKVDASINKLDSGRIGARKRSKLKKFKAIILASVERHRVNN
jgi:hypothetical protein